MPAVLICTKPDGRIVVAAMAEPPPGYEEGAVEAASLEEATRLAQDLLGGENEAAEGSTSTPGEEAAEGTNTGPGDGNRPVGDDDLQTPMQAGFSKARRGR